MDVKVSHASRRADRTRKTILRAAIREFSVHGLAGARTDAIASARSLRIGKGAVLNSGTPWA